MTKAALALIKSTGVNHGDLTVGGLAAAIENAIAAAPEFEGSISEHDETIRQLRAQLDEYEREKLKREAQEPVAFRWLGPGNGWRAVYAAPPVPHVDPDWLANVISSHVSGQIGRGIGMDELRGCDLLAEKIAGAINGRAK